MILVSKITVLTSSVTVAKVIDRKNSTPNEVN